MKNENKVLEGIMKFNGSEHVVAAEFVVDEYGNQNLMLHFKQNTDLTNLF